MNSKKYPKMLVLDGNKGEVRIEQNPSPASNLKTMPRRVLGKKTPEAVQGQELRDGKIMAGDNGGYVCILEYANPYEQVVLLSEDKKGLLEQLDAILPDNSYRDRR